MKRSDPSGSTLPRWLLLAGVGVVVGPAAVVLTLLALFALVLDVTGGVVAVVAGVVGFLAVAIAAWYGAGRVAGALTLRFGGSPFTALGLLVPSVLVVAYVAWSGIEDARALLGVIVFLVNALMFVVLGVRAAERAAIRRLRDPGPPGRRSPGVAG